VSSAPLEIGIVEALMSKLTGATGTGGSSVLAESVVVKLLARCHQADGCALLRDKEKLNAPPLPVSFADWSKQLQTDLVTDSKLLRADGKDSVSLGGKVASASAFSTRVFAHNAFLAGGTGKTAYSVCSQLLERLRLRIQERVPAILLQCSASSPAASAAKLSDDIAFAAHATQSLRAMPVEMVSEEELRAIRFAVADLLPKQQQQKKAPPPKPAGKGGAVASKPAPPPPAPDLPLLEIATCILKRLVETTAGASTREDLGIFSPFGNGMLALTVLGKSAMDLLRANFAASHLSHVLRRMQYRASAAIVLKKCCRRFVDVIVGTGLIARVSTEIVADLDARRRIREQWREQREDRRAAEEREHSFRAALEREKGADLQYIMSVSGGFLMPLIRRRKDRCFRDEMDGRLALMKLESKERRAFVERFFDDEPEEPVPAPVEGLAKIRARYDFVKPTIDLEEAGRREIVTTAREEVLGLVALLELERERIKVKFVEKKEVRIDWKGLERAAVRRQKDEERAREFLYTGGNSSSSDAKRSSSSANLYGGGAIASTSNSRTGSSYVVMPKQQQQLSTTQQQQQQPRHVNPYAGVSPAPAAAAAAPTVSSTLFPSGLGGGPPRRVSFGGYWKNHV
jgi:hypothetical protein